MARAFSIAELVIVVAVVGILAALVVPCIQGQATEAKEAAAKDNLHTLRGAIELYAANHAGVAPGYVESDPDGAMDETCFLNQMTVAENYLRQMPANPFNNRKSILMVGNGASFPPQPTGDHGWLYQPATKTIRLDWPGQDQGGMPYVEY